MNKVNVTSSVVLPTLYKTTVDHYEKYSTSSNKTTASLNEVWKAVLYPAASLYPLVNVVREGFSGHVASWALGGVEVPLLQDDLALADHHQRPAAHLCAFKDVVLHGLQGRGRVKREG